jgi:hypothetical protein
MQTERLAEQLVADLTPVRRVARPAVRLPWWLLISVPATALVVFGFGLRPDFTARLGDIDFLLAEGAALLTALTAIYAALCAGLPDQPGWKVWLPAVPLLLWILLLGRQCLEVYKSAGLQGLSLTGDAMCIPAVAIGGLIPAVAIVVMLRRSARFRTTHACLCATLGAAALGAAALRLHHTQDAALMVIAWQLGSVALFTLTAGVVGRVVVAVRRYRQLITV